MKPCLPDLKKLMCVLAYHEGKMIEREGKFSKGVKNVRKLLLAQKRNSLCHEKLYGRWREALR